MVISRFTEYCRENINGYSKKEFYSSLSRNRKIIGYLNYHKLWRLSKVVLKVKSIISR